MAYSQPTNPPPPNDKAAIYSTKLVPPLKPPLLFLAQTAKISEAQDGDTSYFTCEWPDVTVRFTIKPGWDAPVQRLGMKDWIARTAAGDKDTPAVKSLLHKIDATVDCVGSVITPRCDPAGKASSLVLGLAAKLDGYVFSQKSFYDVTGTKIIGASGAPLTLKDQK